MSNYLFTTFVDTDRPFSIPCPDPAGFIPFAAKFGRCMRAGLAVTARLDLGPTEVARGITGWKNETEKQNQRNSGGDVLHSTPLPQIESIEFPITKGFSKHLRIKISVVKTKGRLRINI